MGYDHPDRRWAFAKLGHVPARKHHKGGLNPPFERYHTIYPKS